MPSTGMPVDLLKTMLWILLAAGKDFKKAKDSANRVISKEITVDKFRSNFRAAFSDKYNIAVNPTELVVPASMHLCYCDNEELLTPTMIFKGIFKNIDPNTVIEIAKTIWDVSDIMAGEFRIDSHTLSTENTDNLSAYSIQMLPYEVLFETNFRKHFLPYDTSSVTTVEIKDRAALIEYLTNKLIDEVRDGSQTVMLPKIVQSNEENQSEA